MCKIIMTWNTNPIEKTEQTVRVTIIGGCLHILLVIIYCTLSYNLRQQNNGNYTDKVNTVDCSKRY